MNTEHESLKILDLSCSQHIYSHSIYIFLLFFIAKIKKSTEKATHQLNLYKKTSDSPNYISTR